MSADPITLSLLAFTALSAGSQIYSGYAEQEAAGEQADLLQEQARIETEETEAEAQRKTEERNKFIAQQKVAFLANGIGLAGTPLVVLEDSFQQYNKEIESIRKSGSAQSQLLRKQAATTEKTGRSKLIGGVLGAGATVAGSVFKGKQAGIF